MSYSVSGIFNASPDRIWDIVPFMLVNLLIYWLYFATAMFALELLVPEAATYWLYYADDLHVRASLPVIIFLYMIGGFFKAQIER